MTKDCQVNQSIGNLLRIKSENFDINNLKLEFLRHRFLVDSH